jgi:hypothetical protein
MAQQLEMEFRVYRIPEPGGKRECIVARNIPHALQAWHESVDSFSRSLELVISGDWLMRLLAQNEREGCGEIDEVERATIVGLCVEALRVNNVQQKQQCLEQILAALGYDPNEAGKA